MYWPAGDERGARREHYEKFIRVSMEALAEKGVIYPEAAAARKEKGLAQEGELEGRLAQRRQQNVASRAEAHIKRGLDGASW